MPKRIQSDSEDTIVIFDGVCNFCNSLVNMIIAHDAHGRFYFSPEQSSFATRLMEQYELDNIALDTFVLIHKQTAYIRSSAALEVCKILGGKWSWFALFGIIPAPLRDFFYKLIARNRYRLFGKKDLCMVPTEELQARFKL